MNSRHFIKALDHARIAAAIARAEEQTSGQIRVFVSHRVVIDPVEAAHDRFFKLGMEKTAARNAVLVFFAPEARKYAVVGDEGIHAKCQGDEFWKTLHGGHHRGGGAGRPGTRHPLPARRGREDQRTARHGGRRLAESQK